MITLTHDTVKPGMKFRRRSDGHQLVIDGVLRSVRRVGSATVRTTKVDVATGDGSNRLDLDALVDVLKQGGYELYEDLIAVAYKLFRAYGQNNDLDTAEAGKRFTEEQSMWRRMAEAAIAELER